MTDDEAFIRAIVASPGDDAPRLVYADWLDDRGDPRGAYLRAELEWAAPWRAGEAPGDRLPLPAAEPLWVYRVSRPPVGVCCDHLRFDDPGPPAAVAWLDAFERCLRLRLPDSVRAFLLNGNGGAPRRMGYRAKDWQPNDLPTFVGRFFPVPPDPTVLDGDPQRGNLAVATTVLNNGFVTAATDAEVHAEWITGRRDMVALADGPNNGLYTVGLTARRRDKIYYVNYPLLSLASTQRLIADSLPAFLAMIRYPAPW